VVPNRQVALMSLLGRHSGYKADVHIPLASFYAQEGLTMEEIAEKLRISADTLSRWSKAYPDFCVALKSSKDEADSKVVQSLYKKALGGDTVAMIFWLKNRQSAKWRDKQEVEQSGMVKVEHSGKLDLSIEDVIREYADSDIGPISTADSPQ
jgi:transcriptional regulator with XRE-family HTH domain